MHLRHAALLSILASASGCYYSDLSRPTDGVTDFRVDDHVLAEEVRLAAEDWSRAGLVIAGMVTVNVEPDGLPVRYSAREDISARCKGPADACIAFRDGGFFALWIADDLSPSRLSLAVRHELAHALVPPSGHLDRGQTGVMRGNSDVITVDDLRLLGAHAEVDAALSGE